MKLDNLTSGHNAKKNSRLNARLPGGSHPAMPRGNQTICSLPEWHVREGDGSDYNLSQAFPLTLIYTFLSSYS